MIYKNCYVNFKLKEFFLKNNFKISRGSKSKIKTLEIKLTKNNTIGRGECVPYKRYDENLKKIIKILSKNRKIDNINGIKALSLRNAISNAYFDLALKKNKKKFSSILSSSKFKTAITIPMYNIKKFTKEVKKIKNIKTIKVKLDQKNVFNYLNIIKKVSPKSKIIIDANESWSISYLQINEKELKKYNILFIEQPVKSCNDQKIKSKLPLCADESFHLRKNVKNIKKIYKWVNIKPDKFGSETDILKSITFAKKNKLKIFFGCMVSSSLSIIPSLRFVKYCDMLDVDGPSFIKKDYKFGVKYKKDYLIYDKKFNYGYKC